ncbi:MULTISPECIES: hypothetical protein [unclassified Paraburkholderia]|uniref:hypothetical protein n=1 Tax=unclassified Paraburkholderia TaxID=2615204 RepID=UPI00161B512E|nr:MULTISPECIES: hypothetical protein [unclassified Paraburkholderia]MBB5447956.1 hypothetical protein [Paraburkholderia sp. WSM4177]MBB5488371.1 hypothetical protein [Paraburkholderia sp. WSM4180]
MTRLLFAIIVAVGLAGCVVAPPPPSYGYGYEPAPAYGYAPGYYVAPSVNLGIGIGGYWGGHGGHWHGH